MKHTRYAAAFGTAMITAAGLGAGVAIAACGSAAQAPAAASTPGSAAYSYYQSMMTRLNSGSAGSAGSMMGGASGSSISGRSGYRWMMGGLAAPAWMRGGALPGFMMGSSGDAGEVMGTLFANAPGARVIPAQAARLGNQVPAGATVSRALHRITFSGRSIRLVILASPADGPDASYRIAGLVNPAILVKAGARVSIEVVNADPHSANGLVVTHGDARSSWTPMMTASPAFPGSALWFLGSPTPAGMHAGTLSFTAGAPGTYRYLCPVPGQAQEGMTGTFIVSGTT
jgi:FtsP/CotA-like multicopper oxidase with cupredoxin domain